MRHDEKQQEVEAQAGAAAESTYAVYTLINGFFVAPHSLSLSRPINGSHTYARTRIHTHTHSTVERCWCGRFFDMSIFS